MSPSLLGQDISWKELKYRLTEATQTASSFFLSLWLQSARLPSCLRHPYCHSHPLHPTTRPLLGHLVWSAPFSRPSSTQVRCRPCSHFIRTLRLPRAHSKTWIIRTPNVRDQTSPPRRPIRAVILCTLQSRCLTQCN